MDSIIKPQIDLKKQPTVVCEKCEGMIFREVTLIKKVPGLMLGSKEDTIVPFPTYRCDDCGHMNEDFRLFDDNNKTNLV
jgi:predicted nucleic acid-binding Zn ribbon protein